MIFICAPSICLLLKKHQEENSLNFVEHLFLFIIKVFGTVKPKANQVRGSRSKETFRDFLGSNIIIHRIPDGKDLIERELRVDFPVMYVFYRDVIDMELYCVAVAVMVNLKDMKNLKSFLPLLDKLSYNYLTF